MPPRVTDKHVFPAVGLFEVRRVGGIVALQLGTPQGEFLFHVRERAFVKHARGSRDDQGNRFRTTIDEIDAERLGGAPGEPAAPDAESGHRRGHPLTAEKRALYLRASVDLRTTPGACWKDVASKHGLSLSALHRWCAVHGSECAEALVAARPPVLKPGGQLL